MAIRDYQSYCRDSLSILSLINDGQSCWNHPNKIVRSIHRCLTKEWEVLSIHAYRERNRAANWIANRSLSLTHGFHFLDTSPSGLVEILRNDDIGVAMPHAIVYV